MITRWRSPAALALPACSGRHDGPFPGRPVVHGNSGVPRVCVIAAKSLGYGKNEQVTLADAMQRQLGAWAHLAGDDSAADRALLLAIAEALDAATPAVLAGDAAALPYVNGCRYALDVLRKLQPQQVEAGDGYDEALAAWDS